MLAERAAPQLASRAPRRDIGAERLRPGPLRERDDDGVVTSEHHGDRDHTQGAACGDARSPSDALWCCDRRRAVRVPVRGADQPNAWSAWMCWPPRSVAAGVARPVIGTGGHSQRSDGSRRLGRIHLDDHTWLLPCALVREIGKLDAAR